MSRFEYKVVPAPAKGLKAKGIKTAEARFSHALETLMNEQAAGGWEYQRAETLPSTERSGLTGSVTEWRNLLVFRRLIDAEDVAPTPELLPAPEEETEESVEPSETDAAAPEGAEPDREQTQDVSAEPATDAGLEDTAQDTQDAAASPFKSTR